jgi:hypothetical protein
MSRLGSAWRLLNLPCEGMARLASESLDRDLGRLERLALRIHRLYCTPCRRYLRQITLLRRALRRLASRLETDGPPPLPGPSMPDDVRERIKRALDER